MATQKGIAVYACVDLFKSGEFELRTKLNRSVFADLPKGWRIKNYRWMLRVTTRDPDALHLVTPPMVEMWRCKIALLEKPR